MVVPFFSKQDPFWKKIICSKHDLDPEKESDELWGYMEANNKHLGICDPKQGLEEKI